MRKLAYLATVAVERVPGLGGKRGRDLEKAEIATVADLLLHVPRRYVDRSHRVPLDTLPLDEEVTVLGTIERVSSRRVRGRLHILDAVVSDGTARLSVVWFNQRFRERQIVTGVEVALSGKVERFRGKLQMKSPVTDVLTRPGESLTTGRIVPIYPSVRGVAPGHLRRGIHNALDIARPVPEILSEDLVRRLDLVERDRALADIHFPESEAAAAVARRRLVFDEFFRIEVALALQKRRQIEDARGIAHTVDGALVGDFLERLPFRPTDAQRRVLDDIWRDMAREHPMHRLLQGEVGSGKTVVAVATLLTAVQSGFQGAVMVPTEVLAEQHYVNIRELIAGAQLAPTLEPEGVPPGMTSLFDEATARRDDEPGRRGHRAVSVALLTSNTAMANFREGPVARSDLLEWIAAGKVDLVVGTHALIQEGVEFGALGAAVIDEQHRFGVHQRVSLKEKGGGIQPDVLIMTATPIPRTLAMTLYGDLDVSTIDEMPPGRPPVETYHVPKDPVAMDVVYERVRREAAAGHQTFVVCPLVEDSDKLYIKSATAEYERLRELLPDLRVGLIHGQLRPAEKEAVMTEFRDRRLDVLVATTVIEVGIDIPNSTVMIIEDADRFGLNQLHQLRGRLSRGVGPNYCFLVADPTTPVGERRIGAMVASNDGFELAEVDLEIRGQGTVFGARQAGVTDLRLANILRDAELLGVARREAFALVEADPDLADHADVRDEVRVMLGDAVEWLFVS